MKSANRNYKQCMAHR